MSAERRGASQNKQSFNVRQKAGELQFDGMAPDIEPQDLPNNRPAMALNLRYDGVISARPGLSQFVDLQGTVTGMHDHQIGAARGLFLKFINEGEIVGDLGPSLGIYDQEQTPAYKEFGEYDSLNDDSIIAKYGDDIVFNDVELQPVTIKKYVSTETKVQEPVVELPSAFQTVSAMIEHEGVLLIAAVGVRSDATATSAIFTWDGTTLTSVLSGIFIVRGFALYRDKCIAVFSGVTGPNSVRVRSASGTWSAPIAPSIGTVGTVYSDCGKSYKDACYIATGDIPGIPQEYLFRYNSNGTLTGLPPATTGISAGVESAILSVDVYDGYLYYLWRDASSPPATIKIGRFDGSTWTANYKDLTAQFATLLNSDSIKQYRAALWVNDGGDTPQLYSSNRGDISGTWLPAVSCSPTARPLRAMLVY